MASSTVLLPTATALPTAPAHAASITNLMDDDERNIHTIDDLLRHRAHGSKRADPIVAYPTQGSEYVYYTPQEVRFPHPSGI